MRLFGASRGPSAPIRRGTGKQLANEPALEKLQAPRDRLGKPRARGVKNVAVTAGYIAPEARAEFFGEMDAANIDLKSFTESFYKTICAGQLGPVLETLEYLVRETEVWTEITTLLIPGENDGPDEIRALSDWVAEKLGPDVPLHVTAFHPDYKMMDTPSTPARTVAMARRIAMESGLTGNVRDGDGSEHLLSRLLRLRDRPRLRSPRGT